MDLRRCVSLFVHSPKTRSVTSMLLQRQTSQTRLLLLPLLKHIRCSWICFLQKKRHASPFVRSFSFSFFQVRRVDWSQCFASFTGVLSCARGGVSAAPCTRSDISCSLLLKRIFVWLDAFLFLAREHRFSWSFRYVYRIICPCFCCLVRIRGPALCECSIIRRKRHLLCSCFF